MDRKIALFLLGVIALLVLPGLAGSIPQPWLKNVAGYALCAFVFALVVAIYGSVSKIINGDHRRERKS